MVPRFVWHLFCDVLDLKGFMHFNIMKIFFPLMTNIEKVKYVLRATKVFGYESGKLLLKYIYMCVYLRYLFFCA